MNFQENRLFIFAVGITIIGFFGYLVLKPDSAKTADVKESSVSTLEMSKAYKKGNPDAKVRLVQYSDFLCPSCSQLSLGVMPEIEKNYIDTGKVSFEFRPMAFIAAGSQTAAEGAYCAADQGKFWEYHDAAYSAVWQGYFNRGIDPRQVPLYSVDGVTEIGKQAGLDSEVLGTCLTDKTHTQEVVKYTQKAQAAGVSGTPYLEVNGRAIQGSPSYEIIEAALKAAGA